MTLRAPCLLVFLAGLHPALLSAQQPPPTTQAATLTFHFERPGLPVPVYTLALHPDGSGSYTAQYAPMPQQASRYGGTDASAPPPQTPESVTLPIQLSQATTAKLFERARTAGYFQHPCEAKVKNIADTGKKVLTYAGPDATGSCTYNYSENKLIAGLTDTFFGIAYTLEEGHTLAASHRFDHLGLDAEMIQFTEAVKQGRALEVGAIAPILRSIAEDPQLLDRVRARATQLLAASETTPAPPPGAPSFQ